MLHDLSTDTCEGYGAVVRRLGLCTLFVNWTNTGILSSGTLSSRNKLL